MTAYSKNRSQYFCRTGRERASWEIAALALILSLIFGYSPASAHSLSPDIILQNPGQFDNKQVAVTGTVRDLQHRASHGGRNFTFFSLCGSSRCLKVFLWGRHSYPKKSQLRVTGTFYVTTHVDSSVFKNEIMGKTVLLVETVLPHKSRTRSPQPDTLPSFLRNRRVGQYETDRLKQSDQILLQQQSPEFHSTVDTPDYSLSPRSRKYAVVIGIESYQSLPRADFAGRDAKDVYRHLVALGYEKRHIQYLRDAKATKSLLKGIFEQWLPTNVNAHPGAEVFVYFSGHGSPGIENHQAYLIPWDGNPEYLKTTGFSLGNLYADLGHLKGKVIVVLDSCFSGAGGRSVLAKGARPLVTRIETPLIARSSNLTVLAAAQANQISTSDEEHGHGTFTYYLLQELNRTKGKTSVGQLYRYVKPKVEEAARLQNGAQTPQLFGSGNGRF